MKTCLFVRESRLLYIKLHTTPHYPVKTGLDSCVCPAIRRLTMLVLHVQKTTHVCCRYNWLQPLPPVSNAVMTATSLPFLLVISLSVTTNSTTTAKKRGVPY
jgi:hypothetical protein